MWKWIFAFSFTSLTAQALPMVPLNHAQNARLHDARAVLEQKIGAFSL